MIALLLDDSIQEYEQDLREILMAFFPGEPFCYEKKPEAGLFVCAEETKLSVLCKRGDARFLTAAEGPGAKEACAEREGREAAPESGDAERAGAAFSGEREETGTETLRCLGTEKLSLSGLRRDNKTRVKRALYGVLSAATGETLPWGTLTGIRPVRLAERELSLGKTEAETIRTLRETYLISEEKTALITEIARREQSVLSRFNYREGFSLYIGIPFCPTTCLYCSFTSYPIARWAGEVNRYLACLREELAQVRRAQETEGSLLYQKPLQTIYIGGGTPTALSAEELFTLLSAVRETLDLSALSEFTVEAGRPDSITEEKLRTLRDFSVDRISINPQTMNQKTLDLIGRRHTTEDVRRAFCAARRAGFQNINMDLIMGLPEETADDVAHTLSEIRGMRPDSLTVHALAVKRAARLNTSGNAWAHLARAGKEEAARMMALSSACAEALGLRPYYLYRQKNMAGNQENTGYAKPGLENLYNILMMEELHTVIGCGAGASSKAVIENEDAEACGGNRFRVERCENIKNIAEYLPRFPELLQKKAAFLR